jgi:hypothetical protein
MTLRQRTPRERDEKHLAFVRTQECCLPFCKRAAEPAHLRMENLAIGKELTGKGEKPSDCFVCPLCPYHHRDGIDCQHNSNEKEWWERTGLNPWAIAASLWIESGGAARATERAKNPKPVKPRKIKPRDRTKPRRQIPARELQSRSAWPVGRKMQSRNSFEKRIPV